jgi:hypothetical protein
MQAGIFDSRFGILTFVALSVKQLSTARKSKKEELRNKNILCNFAVEL